MTKEVRRKPALLILFLLMGLFSLASTGCAGKSNDDDADSGAALCQENESHCDGDMVVLCRMGTWQSWENCAASGEACVENGTDASCEPVDAGLPDVDAGLPDVDSGTPDAAAD
jgi:hypothetical protein